VFRILISFQAILVHILVFFRIGNHIPNGHLIRKSIFKKTGLYVKEAPLEDLYMNMQIAKYSKMKLLNVTLFYYRWHEKNTIKNPLWGIYSYKTVLYELQNYPFLRDHYLILENEINCLKTRNTELEMKLINRIVRKIRKLKNILISQKDKVSK